MPKSSVKQIDQDEKRIIEELRKNANKSINDIAKSCGFSRQKVWRVIKNLEEKKLIWGYTTVFDDEKIGKKHFIIMIKRTMERLDDETLDKIISTETEELAKKFGVCIESSAYIHGEYDWMLTITADDIKQAKQFSELLLTMYHSGAKNIIILQTMFFIRKNYLLNPDKEKLKQFYVD
ncbi:MAG: Lrp/AsnC family transcriptional regulator [Candidatus Thermoplasmatota archaeon]|nr:Lrp/AsnC family transcriptional regulator [Candidatus Thermoplasmatota archaeon]